MCLCLELLFGTPGPAPESPVRSQLTVEFHHPGFWISVTGQAHAILVPSPASVPLGSSPLPREWQRNCQETRLRLVFGATSPQRQQFLLCEIKSRSSRELLMPLWTLTLCNPASHTLFPVASGQPPFSKITLTLNSSYLDYIYSLLFLPDSLFSP